MNSRQLDEEAIFHIARDLTDAAKRATYLDQVCGGDRALRERVEGLLEVHEQDQSFLKSNGEGDPTVDRPSITEARGQQIGRYKLLQKIGEGGFGVVYMAEQAQPIRRKVALKIIKPGMDTNAVVARFEAERQALALMDHPNIARVLDGGATEGGRPYFVMELVKGVQITEYCDKNQLPVRERLRLLATICHAVQHAHQKGIIHRDLKPSNVLVTLHDGKPVVKVIDFGVSKALNQQLTEKTLFTAYGQMVGTPQYMSPEQAEMSGLDIDTRTDVYSLGVMLYELLTGTTPLDAERLRHTAFAELRKIICEQDAPKPSLRLSSMGNTATQIAELRKVEVSQLHRYLSGDLDWIVMKSLEKERNRRYGTPGELADDVVRFLNDEAVEARPPSRSYILRKFVKRNKLAVGAFVTVCVSLLLGLVGTSVGFLNYRAASEIAVVARQEAIVALHREKEMRITADQASAAVVAESQRRERDLYLSEISLAYRLWRENNFRRVDEILTKYLNPVGTDHRGFEWRYLWNATERSRHAKRISFDNVPGGRGSQTRFTSDGSAVCARTWGGVVSLRGVLDETLDRELIDLSIGQRHRETWGQGIGSFLGRGHCSISHVGFWEGDIAFLRPINGGDDVQLGRFSPTESRFGFDRDSRIVATCAPEIAANVFDTKTGQLLASIEDARGERLAVSPDGQLIATGTEGFISIWHIGRNQLVKKLSFPSGVPNCICFAPDNSQIAAASEDGPVRCTIWSMNDGRILGEISKHKDAIRDLAYSPNGKLLATASRDNSVRIWDTSYFSQIEVLKGHSGIVNNVAFSPDGRRIVTASQDYTVVLWQIDDIEVKKRQAKQLPPTRNIELVQERGVACDKERVYAFDPMTGEELAHLYTSDRSIQAMDINSSGMLAVASDNRIQVMRGGTQIVQLNVVAAITSLAMSESGDFLAFGCVDGRVGIADISSGEVVESQKAYPNPVEIIAINPDETTIAAAGGGWGLDDDSDIICWNVDTLEVVQRLPGHRDGVTSLIFSPDGRRLVSGSLDNDVRVWDWLGDEPKASILRGHTASIRDLLFDAKGKRLISSAGDRSVRIWDLETQRQCGGFSIDSEVQGVNRLHWLSQGKTLIGYGDDGRIMVWSGDTSDNGSMLRVTAVSWRIGISQPDSRSTRRNTGGRDTVLPGDKPDPAIPVQTGSASPQPIDRFPDGRPCLNNLHR